MTIQQLDLYFPFIVFTYGFIMTLVTQSPLLKKRAAEALSEQLSQWFYSHRLMGQICLLVGALWSLQRLILY